MFASKMENVCLNAMGSDAPQVDSGDISIGTSDLATSLRLAHNQ